ncbi:MAG: GNAT family N-acetyltransferase [Bacteroidota bacterium]|nr:GNAT family N-acetyltransferase [Bacteroidota bacterium]
MNVQLPLQNYFVKLEPLKATDFEKLFAIARDPLIWEQHPNKDRYKREVFEVFFKGAIESTGAYVIYDAKTNAVIGSSRYYDLNIEKSSITIGYTFFARSHWGGIYNRATKEAMMLHAFEYVNEVNFHIGAVNIRSQKAIEKLGAQKIGEIEMAYYGEASKLNFIYSITKLNWQIQNR